MRKVFEQIGYLLLTALMGEGGELMMAMFFAQRVILGKTEYADVPAKLKEQVKELLIDSGLPELVTE
jgi:hypothetical protein